MRLTYDYTGKRVLIMGLGLLGGGVGVAKFFAKAGAKVTVTDLKTKSELATSLAKLKDFNIRYVLGKHDEEDFRTHALVIRNPAVPANSAYLQIAKKARIPVAMESSIFFQLCPSKNTIGVTGTKGKTTTTLLIGEILKAAKFDVVIGGNLRVSMLELLPKITQKTWVVLELSSWQLEGLFSAKISPHLALITNVMPDHLNRYKTFEDYLAAKKIIFQFQNKNDIFVTNLDQSITKKLAREAKSRVVFFSKKTLPSEVIKKICLPGEHNLLNFAAAYQVTKTLGVGNKTIFQVVEKFRGVPDRLEIIRKFKRVTFINDTTATTPEATIAAISSFSQPIILICGGADKKLDFDKLGKIINRKVKAVLLLKGSATDKIEREIKIEKIVGKFSNFKNAVQSAFSLARPGDIILLSPAAASFGMFKNEFDRGEQFKQTVRDLGTKGK